MDLFELARRLHVADADIRFVDWVNGECFVTLVDGSIRQLHDHGFTVVDAVPPGPLDPTPPGSTMVIIDWVSGDRTRAQQALDDELLRARPRKGLVTYLKTVIS